MRSARKRIVELVGWMTVGGAGLVMVTQALRRPGSRAIAVMQSLTPHLALAMAPLGAAAFAKRRSALGVAASAVGLGGLVLVLPVALPSRRRSVVGGHAAALRIACLNLLYTNDEPNIAVVAADLLDRDLDVIVFVEYTAAHERTFRESKLAHDFPFRLERSGPGASGLAVWSKSPTIGGDSADPSGRTLDVTVESTAGPVRVLGVHAHTPTSDFETWKRDLHRFGAHGHAGTDPTVVIGDFNASVWHPSFRALLADGFTDAHVALGRGFSVSWPDDSWFPPFIRLDHALTTDSLVPLAVEDFDIRGSDHRGLIVTVTPAR
jgi:endonuclease/exonuclease/phosphatase (EEP) superfamily protein YafD